MKTSRLCISKKGLISQHGGSSWNQELTAVVLHVRPDVPLLQTVSKRAVPNIVALLLLHHMHTHLKKDTGKRLQSRTDELKIQNKFRLYY